MSFVPVTVDSVVKRPLSMFVTIAHTGTMYLSSGLREHLGSYAFIELEYDAEHHVLRLKATTDAKRIPISRMGYVKINDEVMQTLGPNRTPSIRNPNALRYAIGLESDGWYYTSVINRVHSNARNR